MTVQSEDELILAIVLELVRKGHNCTIDYVKESISEIKAELNKKPETFLTYRECVAEVAEKFRDTDLRTNKIPAIKMLRDILGKNDLTYRAGLKECKEEVENWNCWSINDDDSDVYNYGYGVEMNVSR